MLSQILEILGSLTHHGNLKTISICPARGLRGVLELGRLNEAFMLRPFVDLLSAAKSKFSKTQIRLRIVIQTGWHSLLINSQIYYRRSTPKNLLVVEQKLESATFDPVLETLKEFQTALGGELWQDSILCYKNGKKSCQPFKLRPGAEKDLNDLDRKLIDDAIKRRALWMAKDSNSLPVEYREFTQKLPLQFTEVDVDHIVLPTTINVDYTENRHGPFGLERFVSGAHPAFALAEEEFYKTYQMAVGNVIVV